LIFYGKTIIAVSFRKHTTMADIIAPSKSGKRKIHNPRIDLTPMVDLGFLLITFFMMTTTMAQPKAMEINMPSTEHTDEPTAFIEESTITLIPIKGHSVIYYNGALGGDAQLKRSAIGDIREILLTKKKEVAVLPATFSAEAHKLHVLIKPNDDCKYEDVVGLLDEMTIVNVSYYAIVDVTPEEKRGIEKRF
jgi:biopolymer transport protein ExbD